MSNVLEISSGPFAGQVLKTNLVPNLNDITTIATVDAIQAHQVFLDTFKPTEGWSLQVIGEVIDLNMVPLPNNSGVAAHCPTALFKASLRKDGNIVNTASTLWVLSGPTEWEKGETNARLRLYQAMGLPTRQDMGIVEPIAGKPRPTLTAVPNPYKDRDTTATQAPNAAQAIEDLPVEAQVEAVAEKQPEVAATEAPVSIQEAQSEPVASTTAEPLVLSNPAPVASADAPSQALLENIRRVCGMRGLEMPSLATKVEAQTFLKKLSTREA